MIDDKKEKTVDDQIEEEINYSVSNINNLIKEYKNINKNTQLTDKQIVDVMNDFYDDGLITF